MTPSAARYAASLHFGPENAADARRGRVHECSPVQHVFRLDGHEDLVSDIIEIHGNRCCGERLLLTMCHGFTMLERRRIVSCDIVKQMRVWMWSEYRQGFVCVST
jgi:hypothetical protein